MIRSVHNPILIAILLTIALAFSGHLWAFETGCGVRDASGNSDHLDERSPALIATADFNRDGIADVAEIVQPREHNHGQCILQIFLGQTDGSYKSALHQPLLNDDPQSMVADDFNGDGNPDLLVGTGDGSVTELLGDGKGNLRFAGEIAHVGSVVSIAVGDFNRDGIPDIAISDFNANSVHILAGSGSGSFTIGWSFALPVRGTTYYLAVADFNGDGVSDLAITSDEEGAFVVMLGNGNGTFTYSPALSNIRDPNSYCPT